MRELLVYDLFCMTTSLAIGMYGVEAGKGVYLLACIASLLFRGTRVVFGRRLSLLFLLDVLLCVLSFLDALLSGIECERAAVVMLASTFLSHVVGWKRAGLYLHSYGHFLIAKTAMTEIIILRKG